MHKETTGSWLAVLAEGNHNVLPFFASAKTQLWEPHQEYQLGGKVQAAAVVAPKYFRVREAQRSAPEIIHSIMRNSRLSALQQQLLISSNKISISELWNVLFDTETRTICKDHRQELKWPWLAFPIDFSCSPWESKHRHHCCFPSDAKSFCKLKYLKAQSPVKLQQAPEDLLPFSLSTFRNTIRHHPMAADRSSLSCLQPKTTWGTFCCYTSQPTLSLELWKHKTSTYCCVSSTV